MPMYRFRDGFSTLRKNDITIERCVTLLEQNEPILIFAEGNHNEQYNLRALQKGFVRIALAAEEKSNWSLGLQIVPVGIHYDSREGFRSRVLVTFGKPIAVEEIINAETPAVIASEKLIEHTVAGFKPLMLHINPENYAHNYAFWRTHRIYKTDLVEQLKADQQVADLALEHPIPALSSYKNKTRKAPWWNPVFVYGFINHFLPWKVLTWVLKNKVRDHQFIASIKFALGMFLVPIVYLLQSLLLWAITGSLLVAGVYFITLPIFGVLAHSFYGVKE